MVKRKKRRKTRKKRKCKTNNFKIESLTRKNITKLFDFTSSDMPLVQRLKKDFLSKKHKTRKNK